MRIDFGRWLLTVLFAGAAALSVPAKDVVFYKITKGIRYQQTITNEPTRPLENAFVFQANVRMSLPGSVRTATIRSAEGTVRLLEPEDADDLEFRDRVDTKATLDSRYPEGNFTLAINTAHDGNKALVLRLLADAYPPVPRIANLPALQSVNADGFIIVRWEPFTGGTAGDFVQLRIEDSGGDRVFETADHGEPGALDGTATYAVLDPRTLEPGKRYAASLRFEKTETRNTTAYPDVLGWSTHHRLTDFPIVASSGPAPVVELYEVAKGRSYEQTTAGAPFPELGDEFRFQVAIEASGPDLISGASFTSPRGTTTLPGNAAKTEFEFSDSQSVPATYETLYPFGSYRFNISTVSQGILSPTLAFTSQPYPPAPHVQFNPQVDVRADQDLRITWGPWAGGTINDFVQLRIEDAENNNVFETPDLGENEALHGLSTFAIIPAGTLLPATTYSARLTFRRYVQLDTTTLPGSLGAASVFSRLKFPIETVPPDVESYLLTKGADYIQYSPATIVPSHFTFRANIAGQRPGSVISATLTTPNAAVIPLRPLADGVRFGISETRTTQSELDAVFPDGTYAFRINATNDGIRTMYVALTNSAYPAPPRVENFDHAGRVDTTQDFGLSWFRFSGGTIDDFIAFVVTSPSGAVVSRTPDFGEPNALFGSHTETLIVADLLAPGTVYTGGLTFENVISRSQTNYAKVPGRTGYFSRTRFSLITLGPGNPATISGPRLLPDGQIQFSFNRAAGVPTYVIHGSPDLVNWTVLGFVPYGEGPAVFTAPRPDSPSYFYRAFLAR